MDGGSASWADRLLNLLAARASASGPGGSGRNPVFRRRISIAGAVSRQIGRFDAHPERWRAVLSVLLALDADPLAGWTSPVIVRGERHILRQAHRSGLTLVYRWDPALDHILVLHASFDPIDPDHQPG